MSQLISEKCVEFIHSLSGANWSDAMMAGLAEYFEHPIRKLAHFSEYACMGILVYVLWSQWMRRDRRLYLLTVGWVALSAACDEFHQYFVPGRYASVADVLLDTCGGAFGMLFCIFVAALHRRRRKQRIQGKGAKAKVKSQGKGNKRKKEKTLEMQKASEVQKVSEEQRASEVQKASEE